MLESHFELDGAFTMEQVRDVRRFVERLHLKATSREVLSRVSMAAHELFENAVKFSSDGNVALRVERREPDGQIQITTCNRASTEDVVALCAMALRMRRASNLRAFYVDLMRQAPHARGGLGIGRVAAEAELDIDVELDGDVVVVRAAMDLERWAA